MKKIPLSDGSGRWFNPENAKVWKESVSHEEADHRDAHNPHGEKLYLTVKGSFVLHAWHWSTEDRYHQLDQETAAKWLISNGYQKDIPKLELQSEERKLEI